MSAGAPVSGAIVTVYAVSDATGEVNTSAGSGGVLGTAGPTDSEGNVSVSLTASGYSGPVQIIATGAAMFYADPTTSTGDGTGPNLVQLPSSFALSSYVAQFPAVAARMPVTLLTTLADHVARAFARGRHPSHPTTTTITDALAARDPLVVRHIVRGDGWDPATFRSTLPASVTSGPDSLVDSTFAALFDIALNQLARDTSGQAGYAPGAAGFDASALLELLEQDVDADGELDGRGDGGAVLQTPGPTPVTVDGQFLRLPLGHALQSWIDGPANGSRLKESDLIGAGVFAAIVEDRSDLFGAAPAFTATVLIDRSPPVLAWTAPPPVAVATRAVSLRIGAVDDRTGVKRVLGQVGPNQPLSASLQPDGTWLLNVRLDPGPNRVSIWAEDDSPLGPNSGQFAGPPYELDAVIISDTSVASVIYNAALASYRDERGMTLATDTAGHARVPPAYVLASQPVPIPATGGHVYKAASRLAWGSTPTAATLEDAVAGNPDNIPVLQFMVPVVDGVDAPIVEANYSVSIACTSCSISPVTGPLWPASASAPNAALYDLPLSANLIPALQTLPGPASLAVAISVTDAAGNSSTLTPVTLTFHTIGPPLTLLEDVAYPTRNDPKSTYPYTIRTGLYPTLFDTGTAAFLPENAVRLVRYLVENPAPEPVALSLPAFSVGWRMVESWIGDGGTPLGTKSYAVTRVQCSASPGCSGTTPISYSGISGSGCGASPPHGFPATTDTPTVGAGALTSFAYNQALGGDLSQAQATPTGQVLVPAALASAPGVLALYVARPRATAPRSYVLPWNGTAFSYAVEDAWIKTSQGTRLCCDFDQETQRCLQSDAPSTWSGTRYSRVLFSGVDVVEASFHVITTGTLAGLPVGEPSDMAPPVPITRTIAH